MLLFWRAIIHYRFLDIQPLALQTIVDHIAEGFVVLSCDNIVINFNLPFIRMFDVKELASKKRTSCHFSRYAEKLGINSAELDDRIKEAVAGQTSAVLAITLEGSTGTRHIDIEITPVFSGTAHIGSILLFKDQTELRGYLNTLEIKKAEIEKLNIQLKNLAEIDGLTGAYNRRFFDEYFRLETSRYFNLARHRPNLRSGNVFGLAILDIDHFKTVNDRWGHVAGDEILREIVRILKGSVFGRDIVCRYGGEEFAIIFANTDAGGLALAAEKIRASVASHEFIVGTDAVTYTVTVSIGIAVATEDFAHRDPVEIIRRADENLYAAKQNGRNRVVGCL
jgi:diguanylate cyclase (GGDEF)-like protein